MANAKKLKAAWLYLARQFDRATYRKSPWFNSRRFMTPRGACCICDSLITTHRPYNWTCELADAMKEMVLANKPEEKFMSPATGNRLYSWSITTKNGARQRAAFCRRMAKLCEKEKNNG